MGEANTIATKVSSVEVLHGAVLGLVTLPLTEHPEFPLANRSV